MRLPRPIPDGVVDPATGAVRFGTYEGGFARVDLSAVASPFVRRFRRKRWLYLGVATPETYVGLAVVDLGYAGSAFAFAYDVDSGRMLAQASAKGLRARVANTAGEGCLARFASGSLEVDVARPVGDARYSVRVRARDFVVDAALDTALAAPSMTAVTSLGDGCTSVTEKRGLLAATGTVRTGGAERALDGGLALYDYTHGLLRRHTVWNWAMLLGHADDGAPIAMNLVGGFMGDSECVVFSRDGLTLVGEGRFTYARERPIGPWEVTTDDGAIALAFEGGAAHEERMNAGVVRSAFVQPVGTFSGTLRRGESTVRVARAVGVVEDQDSLW